MLINKQDFFYFLNNSYKLIFNDNPNQVYYCYSKKIERQLKYKHLFNVEFNDDFIFDANDIIFDYNLVSTKFWVVATNIYMEKYFYDIVDSQSNKKNIRDFLINSDWNKNIDIQFYSQYVDLNFNKKNCKILNNPIIN